MPVELDHLLDVEPGSFLNCNGYALPMEVVVNDQYRLCFSLHASDETDPIDKIIELPYSMVTGIAE